MSNLYLEVDLQKIYENIGIIRKNVGNKKIIAVVKGNAYGLGIESISNFLEDKVDMFAVSNLKEAKNLFDRGINRDILILTPVIYKEYFYDDFIEEFIVTIDDEFLLEYIPKNKNIRVHIYVCTGMNRKGIKINQLDELINNINTNYKNINIEGIYTHLHNFKDEKYTLYQVEKFYEVVQKYIGKYFVHVLNSGGFMNTNIRNACNFADGVRVGNIIYGYDGNEYGIKQSFNYFAKINCVYEVRKGNTIGYGNKAKVIEDTRVGIIEIGYINKFGLYRDINRKNIVYDVLKFIYRYFIKRYEIFKDGKHLKILGKPNMNMVLIDCKNLNEGDYVKIIMSPILGDSSIYKKYVMRSG